MTEVVVVSGATSGIGEACVRRFLAEGARVVAIGRRADRLDALAASSEPDALLPVALDLRDRGAVEQAMGDLPESHRRITVLVNNAGLALGPASALGGTPEQWETMVDTNVKGVLHLTGAVLPGMVERDHGHVINIGSIGGSYAGGSTVYGGTKAFVHHFSLALRRDLLGRRVRVTCVEPGSVATEFNLVRLGDPGKAAEAHRGYRPMSADEMAEVVHYCHRLPAHMNVNRIEVMPVMQAPGAFVIARED